MSGLTNVLYVLIPKHMSLIMIHGPIGAVLNVLVLYVAE